MHEDLLDLKFWNESEIIEIFLKSGIPNLKNNYDTLVIFLGIFYFITFYKSVAKTCQIIFTLLNYIILKYLEN